MATIKVGSLIQYPDWTGLKTKWGRVIRIGSYKGITFYDLNNGDQLDNQSFAEGAIVIGEE